ncbi:MULTISPECIES: ABC transporter ATP-binding protein [Mycetocola]|uniref:ABC transporter ATP-binding protein n=1 Tax=Mycetocola lacteus TaxID=76637 RepID=A0A3L7AJP1_9MICO|nr:ABC transporter ATP-binding protein [Mycetocola lacteus]RLP79821.1 ABC transporter ATP-binding protein [Mycetocola lacteus]
MTTTDIIRVHDVSKRFVLHQDKSLKERVLNVRKAREHRNDFWALSNIDLTIQAGTTVGLVGHNGSGKSTLLKVIGGILQPTTGKVERRGRLAALLELGAGFHPDLTGRENVYLNAAILGLSREETDAIFDDVVEFSGIESFIETQVKFYSSGMYVRLAFAVAIHVEPDLLLVDEVLAVGDEPFQRKCMDKIAEFQSQGRTIVLVSHSAAQVGSLCDRVIVLDGGKIMHDGDPAKGLAILRAGYEADRVAHEAEAPAPAVDSYRIANATATFDPTTPDDVRVGLDVEVLEPRDSWGIGLSIENSLGTHLYGMTTFDRPELVLPNTRGVHHLEIVLPQVRVGAGTYLVNIGLGNQAGETFHRIAGAASFAVEANDFGYGLIRINPEITVTS